MTLEADRHLDRLHQVQAALPFPVTTRPMFSGYMVYADGRPFAALSTAGFAVKLPAAGQHQLLELPGAERLQHTASDRPSRSHIVIPDQVLNDDDRLVHGLRRSAQATT